MSMAAACNSAAEQAHSGDGSGGFECNDWTTDNGEALRRPRNKGIDELRLPEPDARGAATGTAAIA
jgi:hypothetical protein